MSGFSIVRPGLRPGVLAAMWILLALAAGGPSAGQSTADETGVEGPYDSTPAGSSLDRASAPSDADGTGPSSSELSDEDAPTLFVRAGSAYREGRYSEASRLYLALVEQGFDGADVRYNLGNSYLRSGELALAIAEYRKALILNPRDRDAQANLAFARQSATDAVAPPEPAPWRRSLLFWHDGLGWSEKVKLALLAALVFWVLLALRSWRGRWPGTVWPALTIALIAVGLGLSALAESAYPTRVAVVLPVRVDVYSGTDLRSQVIFNLHAGTEVQVERSDREWTEFTLSDGRRGWIPTEQVVVVDSRKL